MCYWVRLQVVNERFSVVARRLNRSSEQRFSPFVSQRSLAYPFGVSVTEPGLAALLSLSLHGLILRDVGIRVQLSNFG
jgi:hypothetical protein